MSRVEPMSAAPGPAAEAPLPGGRLVLRSVVKRFGGFSALAGVDFTVGSGEVVGLVGPNGSGKTTLINVVSGIYPPSAGSIELDGVQLTHLPPHRRVALGLNRTFQIPKPFASLTVAENLAVPLAHTRRPAPAPGTLLAQVGLAGQESRVASTLNPSEQKRLDLARALATAPTVLLVDELGAGLAPGELGELAGTLRSVAARGTSLVVVEHLLGFLEQLADRVVVLNAGAEIFAGTLADAVADPEVKRVFLGA